MTVTIVTVIGNYTVAEYSCITHRCCLFLFYGFAWLLIKITIFNQIIIL